MSDKPTKALAAKALLPTGLRDLLPPDAEHEAQVVGRLLKEFHRHGYERVKPPLVEFEEGLLSGSAATLANQTFRIMDPVSQRMMGVRSDMTPQVARIATTRLRKAPRPLRLSYAGQVLRVKGTGLRQERQFGQVGVELIGPDRAEADAEIILLAASALGSVGAKGISIDLTVPTLVPAVAQALSLTEEDYARLRAALDHRDAKAVADAMGPHAPLFLAILEASGPAPAAVQRLAAIDLPAVARKARAELTDVVRLIEKAAPGLSVTIDPVEMRGFEYQTGVSFTIFARGVRGELGRGGRYRTGGADPVGEPATGFTLYTDTVLRALPGPRPARRVLLPPGTDYAEAQALRAQGWYTVAAMDATDDPVGEARRLGCSHLLTPDGPVPV
ncbi:ATP phosphoribosyltransferase regulatory subunit [Niveispirillum fermenti]|uniref:ATP phosphoribosyltransferase regulatory subunit n=1 Tax=Niveispirillum fermenti TaxID=1233113 RepID=UPI003A880994